MTWTLTCPDATKAHITSTIVLTTRSTPSSTTTQQHMKAELQATYVRMWHSTDTCDSDSVVNDRQGWLHLGWPLTSQQGSLESAQLAPKTQRSTLSGSLAPRREMGILPSSHPHPHPLRRHFPEAASSLQCKILSACPCPTVEQGSVGGFLTQSGEREEVSGRAQGQWERCREPAPHRRAELCPARKRGSKVVCS